jgi:hypothetical protein
MVLQKVQLMVLKLDLMKDLSLAAQMDHLWVDLTVTKKVTMTALLTVLPMVALKVLPMVLRWVPLMADYWVVKWVVKTVAGMDSQWVRPREPKSAMWRGHCSVPK